ncbi:MAG TPA: HD domain-containing phosphohydrolase [Terriglobales bacterium]|nr:HD domain-containing phosphohydrolase [Terriglobales bacterium]
MALAVLNDPRRKRVAAFTIALARAMGVSAEEVRLLARIAFCHDLPPHKLPFAGAVEILCALQESYDGSGQPNRLHGDQIPLRTYILKVATALETGMIDWRIHPLLSLSRTKTQIKDQSGKDFHPSVVSAFLHIPDALWIHLIRSVDEHRF